VLLIKDADKIHVYALTPFDSICQCWCIGSKTIWTEV